MVLQAAAAEPSDLDLVLPDFAEVLWGGVALVLLLVIAGVVALIVVLVKGARSSRHSVARDAQLNELAQRVRALEEQAQSQKAE